MRSACVLKCLHLLVIRLISQSQLMESVLCFVCRKLESIMYGSCESYRLSELKCI